MKQTNKKENTKQPEERDIAITQGTTSTDFTKANKAKFLQTISSNFSHQSNHNQKNIKSKILSRNNNLLNQESKTNDKIFSPFKTVESFHRHSKTTKKTRGSIVPLLAEKSSKNINKNLKSTLVQNLLLPRNINSYTHLIRGKGVGIYAEIDWALRLRDYSNNETKVLDYKDYYYRKNNNEKIEEIKQEKEKEENGIKLTDNFAPPYFYEDDLKKYKNKIKNSEKSLVLKLNPNFYKIRHLIFRNKGDHSNESQFNFATTLRNIKTLKENNKKFEVLPVVEKNNNINKYFISKFLAPCTKYGIQNLKKIDKFITKKFEFKYKQDWVGGEKIFKKILSEDNKYTLSGIGETLGDVKYDNFFGDNNMFSNREIIKTESNPFCKFELNLRNYGNDEDVRSRSHRVFKQKKKK